LEVCRQVAVAFDSNGTGRINFSDFKNLMCRSEASLDNWGWVDQFKRRAIPREGYLF
jgi:hypothetical protein